MRADDPSPRPDDALDAALARVRRATDAIEPPADFTAGAVSRALSQRRSRPSPQGSVWAHLGPVGRRFVPAAALAAAASLALAWSAQEHVDDSADSALDLAQGLP